MGSFKSGDYNDLFFQSVLRYSYPVERNTTLFLVKSFRAEKGSDSSKEPKGSAPMQSGQANHS